MGDIRFLGRARGGRCIYCHDSLTGDVQTCPECSGTWHQDCGRGQPRCPTIGCSGPAAGASTRPPRRRWLAPPATMTRPRPGDLNPDRGRPPRGARSELYARLAGGALVNALLAIAATAYLLWPVVDWAAFWRFFTSGTRTAPPSTVMGGFWAFVSICVALLVALGTCDWLRRLPGLLREVASLLDDTRPTAMRLTVSGKREGKNTTWTARLEGAGTTLSISLGLPGWLRKANAYEDHPVLVYGLPPPGPYVIEFRDGALALVHAD